MELMDYHGRSYFRALVYLGIGWTVEETAQLKGVTVRSVRQYRRKALQELGARDVAHAMEILMERGELTPEEAAPVTDEERAGLHRSYY
ncbi:hypothetical protein ACFU8I_00625 [Streptomyces sp. NPDC057540]|uniref:hypothetical protein n=1 Tax=Streptomyces sp. NPDC057540 TaxID=3346160 RepID=UPI0036BED9F7